MHHDLFCDAQGQPRMLRGCAINSGSARLAEIAAKMGFETVWIEMEHASADLSAAEAMCVATEAGGGIPMVRTAGTRREQILHALEIGARIVVVPMVQDGAMAREVVQYGKFAPLGQRGFNTRGRTARYGIEPMDLACMNAVTYLFPQIETMTAVANLDEILAVPGLAGIFIGPGDLSVDMGITAQFDNPQLLEVVCTCIRRARAAGRHAGIYMGEGPLLTAAIEAGADLCVITSDMGAIIQVWRAQLAARHA